MNASNVVVTGAGRGLGAAYAHRLALAGMAVVVNDIDRPAAERVAGELRRLGLLACPNGDAVDTWDGAEALVSHAEGEFGPLAALVNNAGVVQEAPAWEQDLQLIKRVVGVNLLGTMFVGTHAIRAMRASGGGAIVNISSGAARGAAGLGAYAATKGGIASLTYSWALDCLDAGVRVNAVVPVAATRMNAHVTHFGDGRREDPRYAPARVAPLVEFLVSPRSAGVTGRIFRLDGSRLALLEPPEVIRASARAEEWTTEAVEEWILGLGLTGPTG